MYPCRPRPARERVGAPAAVTAGRGLGPGCGAVRSAEIQAAFCLLLLQEGRGWDAGGGEGGRCRAQGVMQVPLRAPQQQSKGSLTVTSRTGPLGLPMRSLPMRWAAGSLELKSASASSSGSSCDPGRGEESTIGGQGGHPCVVPLRGQGARVGFQRKSTSGCR